MNLLNLYLLCPDEVWHKVSYNISKQTRKFHNIFNGGQNPIKPNQSIHVQNKRQCNELTSVAHFLSTCETGTGWAISRKPVSTLESALLVLLIQLSSMVGREEEPLQINARQNWIYSRLMTTTERNNKIWNSTALKLAVDEMLQSKTGTKKCKGISHYCTTSVQFKVMWNKKSSLSVNIPFLLLLSEWEEWSGGKWAFQGWAFHRAGPSPFLDEVLFWTTFWVLPRSREWRDAGPDQPIT